MENKKELLEKCIAQLRNTANMIQKITFDERPSIFIEAAIRCVKDKCFKILTDEEELEDALKILTEDVTNNSFDEQTVKIEILTNIIDKYVDKNIK